MRMSLNLSMNDCISAIHLGAHNFSVSTLPHVRYWGPLLGVIKKPAGVKRFKTSTKAHLCLNSQHKILRRPSKSEMAYQKVYPAWSLVGYGNTFCLPSPFVSVSLRFSCSVKDDINNEMPFSCDVGLYFPAWWCQQ